MGRLIEDTEIQLRGDLDALYLQRTREIVHAIRKGGGQVGSQGDNCAVGDSERGGGSGLTKQGQQQQRAPPAGGIRLPGMGGGGPPGHQQSLFEAINRRRAQREEEDVVEG